jgi:acetyl-CoA acetyltransferase
MARENFRDQFAIVGIGMTPTARSHAPNMSALALETWAAKLALEDAGLERDEVDGAIHTMMATPHTPAQWVDSYSRTLGLKPNFYLNVARGGQTAHNGVLLATQALSMGLANFVVVACGLPGWSSGHPDPSETSATRTAVGISTKGILDMGLGRLGFDAAGGPGIHALYASRYIHEYGAKPEHFGSVAVAMRQWANLNPEARFYDRTLTMSQYLDSPYVVRPLRRFDCCVQSDLGAALIVTTAERARSMKRPAIYIKGLGLGDQAREQWWDKTNYTQTDGAVASRTALAQAGITLDDIDVAEVYDCFTTEVLFYMEDYGWCRKGDGGDFVATGATAPGGSIPVNTHGGLLSGMYLFDWPGVIEAVRQLRWDCGERQVAGAEIALTNGHGGEMITPGMCASHATMILGRSES